MSKNLLIAINQGPQVILDKPGNIAFHDVGGVDYGLPSLKRKSDYLLEAKFNLRVFSEDKRVEEIETKAIQTHMSFLTQEPLHFLNFLNSNH